MHDEPRPGESDPEAPTERHAIPSEPAAAGLEPATVFEPVTASEPATVSEPVTASEPVTFSEPATVFEPASYEPATPPVTPVEPGWPSDRYVPPPEPRADWTQTWDTPVAPTPERWYEPAAVVQPVTPVPARRRGGGVATLFAVALLSAVLASGGTYLALNASGALEPPGGRAGDGARDERRRRRNRSPSTNHRPRSPSPPRSARRSSGSPSPGPRTRATSG